mgnify:CR=1 FL=1
MILYKGMLYVSLATQSRGHQKVSWNCYCIRQPPRQIEVSFRQHCRYCERSKRMGFVGVAIEDLISTSRIALHINGECVPRTITI